MVAPTAGLLRRPGRAGFIGPQTVLQAVAATESRAGAEARDRVLQSAQLYRLPGEAEPVREDKAVRLHKAIRSELPDLAAVILGQAGAGAAENVIARRITRRGAGLLRAMPWPISLWMLERFACQQAWTFAGTGRFVIETGMRFALQANPFVRGESRNETVCEFHVGLFERLATRLVDPLLRCEEIQCAAAGASYCQFQVTRLNVNSA